MKPPTLLARTLLDWVFHRRGRELPPIRLTQRRIFLLPTRHGVLFGVVLLVMLGGSINYALSLGFVLTFLLGSMAIVSILHAFRNLSGLEVDVVPGARAFAGETARFEITLHNPHALTRYAVGIAHESAATQATDCPARQSGRCTLRVPALRRGRLHPGRLTVFTRYPLGLFYAWAYVEADRFAIVYPRPESTLSPIPVGASADGARALRSAGQDDFAGLRPWHVGDSPQRIAWKAVARGQGLLTKQFVGDSGTQVWLDWDQLPGSLGDEARLSRLARWVLEADTAGSAFGLRLPGLTLPPAAGETQREAALEALALYGSHA
ncbi:MAG: DUF58 domain-containing protein [Proteobacteria bacterium]|nr:DUF58 domain-containing protein [Burkholderiales bacterium]